MKEPTLVTTEAATVAVLRMTGPYSQIPAGYGTLYGWVTEHGFQPAGMPAAVYLTNPADVPEDSAIWELWAPIAGDVPAAKADTAGVEIRHEPPVQALSAMHTGPYDTVGTTYEVLLGWVASHEYEICGPPRERYYTDPDDVPPEEYLTEILLPVCKTE